MFALEDPAEDGFAREGALALDVFAAVGEKEAGLGRGEARREKESAVSWRSFSPTKKVMGFRSRSSRHLWRLRAACSRSLCK